MSAEKWKKWQSMSSASVPPVHHIFKQCFSLSFYCWPGKMLPGSCLSYSSLVKQLHFILNSIPGDYCCFVPVVVCIFVFGIVGKTMTVSVGERRVQCFGFVFYPQKTLIIFMNVIFGIGLEQFKNCGK